MKFPHDILPINPDAIPTEDEIAGLDEAARLRLLEALKIAWMELQGEIDSQSGQVN